MVSDKKIRKKFEFSSPASVSKIIGRLDDAPEDNVSFGRTSIIRRGKRNTPLGREKAKRFARWSDLKDKLSGKEKVTTFDSKERYVSKSMVYDAIMSRYDDYDKNLRSVIDDMVFVLFDDLNATVDDIERTADNVVDVCVESNSAGVCGTLLEVNDMILFANEELGFVGETNVRKQRRLAAYRISDRILEKLRPSLISFSR